MSGWLLLVTLAFAWGVLTALSWTTPGFWLRPPTTLFGIFALCVLTATLVRQETNR